MFKRLINWLRQALTADKLPAPHRSSTRDADVEVPAGAIKLAHRLLRTCLETLDSVERVAEISEMRIASFRVLVECLPLRVYVYSLGSFMADMDYKSILRSNRPAGAVFDAFELRVGNVRCGFYVYSLQPFSGAALLNSLWCGLRKEVGDSVETADLPEIHTRHHGAASVPSAVAIDKAPRPVADASTSRLISLDSDPEVIVQSLIGQALPSQQLATYELAVAEEVMKPIFAFVLTQNEYPFEREDMIDFARRNDRILRHGGMAILVDIRRAMAAAEPEVERQFDRILALIDVFRSQIQLVLDGRDDAVDVRSETIYWLITILVSQVEGKLRSLDDAASYLERDRYRARLGPATLRPMFLEFSRSRGTPEEKGPALLYLLLQAAILSRDTAVMIAGREVLASSSVDPSVWRLLLGRCQGPDECDLDEAGRAFVREVRSRNYTEVDDADF